MNEFATFESLSADIDALSDALQIKRPVHTSVQSTVEEIARVLARDPMFPIGDDEYEFALVAIGDDSITIEARDLYGQVAGVTTIASWRICADCEAIDFLLFNVAEDLEESIKLGGRHIHVA
jgi:hypothetical protein